MWVFVFLVNEKTVFILFLVVNDKIRSKGYGSQIITWIKENYPDREIFLDVESLMKMLKITLRE